jgi:hypothetical protein
MTAIMNPFMTSPEDFGNSTLRLRRGASPANGVIDPGPATSAQWADLPRLARSHQPIGLRCRPHGQPQGQRSQGAIQLTGLALQELQDVVDGTTVQLQDVVDGPVN